VSVYEGDVREEKYVHSRRYVTLRNTSRIVSRPWSQITDRNNSLAASYILIAFSARRRSLSNADVHVGLAAAADVTDEDGTDDVITVAASVKRIDAEHATPRQQLLHLAIRQNRGPGFIYYTYFLNK